MSYSVTIRSLLKNKYFYLGLALSLILITTAGIFTLRWLHKPVANNSKIIDENIIIKSQQHVRVVRTQSPEKGVLLYITDNNNTREQTYNYAKSFAALSYYVVVINDQNLLNAPFDEERKCLNLAGTLIKLANSLQDYYHLNTSDLPILAGTNGGAAVVYAALAQAEKKEFHAGVSIGFSPNLASHTTLCHLDKDNQSEPLIQLNPVKHLPSSWYIFQDKNTAELHLFTDRIGNAKLTIADNKDQTALSEAIQILQWLDPRLKDQISSANSDSNLPLIEVPIDNKTPAKFPSTSMAIILTGDGGWAEIDKNVANILAEKGIPTVALDSLSYFWKKRTPEETAQAIEDTMTEYMAKWHKQDVILIGYSFGADVLPFVANKLSADAQKNISLVALLGMGKTAAFEFHLSSWMNTDKDPSRLAILPEIKNLNWTNTICIYGLADPESNCKATEALGIKIIGMSGDHHFDKKYEDLVKHIIENKRTRNI